MNTTTNLRKGSWLQLNERRAARTAMLLLLLLLTLPAAVQAQYYYTTNNGTMTITGYTGSAAYGQAACNSPLPSTSASCAASSNYRKMAAGKPLNALNEL